MGCDQMIEKDAPSATICKSFAPGELLPFAQLRSLNQKDCRRAINENGKLGIMIKGQLSMVLVRIEEFELMVDALQEYSRGLEMKESDSKRGESS
jgi:hypothetical protein